MAAMAFDLYPARTCATVSARYCADTVALNGRTSMPSSTANAQSTAHSTVKPVSLLFHLGKTAALVSAIARDARVHWLPKLFFFSALGALLLALLFPESAAELMGLGIPGVGWALDAIGIPVDATIDWAVMGVAAFNLLKLFPRDVVGEHYDRLFRK
jgi:hypothetical protein